MESLKNKLKSGNSIIVLDTNVLLGLYRLSPQWSEWGLKCLSAISQHIVFPHVVTIEYKNHHKALFSKMKKRTNEYDAQLIQCIKNFEDKSFAACDEIEKLRFPNTSDLRQVIKDGIAVIEDGLERYSVSQEALEIINQEQAKSDTIHLLFEELIRSNQAMPGLTADMIYLLCQKGNDRYKKETPPGFKDAKSKDGVRKYSDYMIWHEIIQYAKDKSVDVIFVTNDVKSDWWEVVGGKRIFHSKLVDEFLKGTSQNITSYTSDEFFVLISKEYHIPEYDTIEALLSITAQSYGNEINHDVFEKVQDDFCNNPEEYINNYEEVCLSDGFEIDDGLLEFTFLSSEFLHSDEDGYHYSFKYRIKIIAESHEYWGRDDDTKQYIYSPANWHTFEGIVEIKVIRIIEDIDDLPYDAIFESAEILSGELEQTGYKPYSFSDYDDEEQKQGYTICPRCDKGITFETDALNGFCVNCPDKN